MIHISKRSRLVMFGDWVDRNPSWPALLEAAGGTPEALIVEAIRCLDEPLCPGCLCGIEDDLPAGGAGLMICPDCLTRVVVLRFAGEGHHAWYSLPWPK
jgi:hypothetical protein